MRPALYTVDHPGPGQLSTMAKPRGADWLDDEMAGLRAIGVDILVCTLTSSELTESGLEAEAQAARSAGLQFVHTPIPDKDVPDLATVLPTLRQLTERLHGGAHVVIHCRFASDGHPSWPRRSSSWTESPQPPHGNNSNRREGLPSPTPPSSDSGPTSCSARGLDNQRSDST